MSTSRQAELASERVTACSRGRRTARRIYGWLPAAVAALALTALTAAPPAEAGVEFVTSAGDCTKVDEIGDGKDLFIMAGLNARFRVFGNSVDLSNPSTGFRIATDSGAGSVTARIVSQGVDCGIIGFALVEVDSSREMTSDIQRSLYFKMPAGDESRLQMKIKAYPTINVTWNPSNIDCIVKTGSIELLNQDHKIRITLPPGHREDQTTCNQRTLSAQVIPSTSLGEVDIPRSDFNYAVSGLPAFMTLNQPAPRGPQNTQTIQFPINVASIRALTTTSNSTITVTSPNPNRTSTLNLEVVPSPLANGFTQAANCRNLQTGDLVNVNDLVQCELRLAAPPPAAGQLITFEALDRLCVAAGAPNVTYSSASGIGTTTLTGTATIFQVPLRVLGVNTSAGTPCASLTGVQHTVKFWIGARDIESGADFTQDTFRIRSVP